MARIVGIFRDDAAVDAVVEQLRLNGIEDLRTISARDLPAEARDNAQATIDHLRGLGVPAELTAEYRERLQNELRLLLVQSSATELPTVQRAMRQAQAVDIDLLPEPGA